MPRRGRHWHASCKNGLERKILPIEAAGVVLILVDHIAGKINTGEYAPAARIGEQGGIRQFSSRSLRIAPNRSRCDGYVPAELNLILEKSLKTIMTGCDDDQICGLASSLQTETRSCHLYEDRRAPSMARAA